MKFVFFAQMTPDGLRDSLQGLAKASVVLGREDAPTLKKAAVVLQSFQEANVNTFMAKHHDCPVLCSYSAGATSLLCATITTAKHVGNTVLRRGRALHEMLLQRVVFVARSSEGRDVSVLVVPPRALDEGKTAWHQILRLHGLVAYASRSWPSGDLADALCVRPSSP